MTETPAPTPRDRPGTGRDETENERLDRNWGELLQELRVTQTGTQILTGFLLAVAFQPRFADLDAFQVRLYLVLVVLTVVTTALALAPVSLHRGLFHRGMKRQTVRAGNALTAATLACLSVVLPATALLIVDVVVGRGAAFVTAGALFAVLLTLWVLVPAFLRHRHGGVERRPDDD